ncbi:MAG: amidase [Rhodocyclaceae bacterium]
MLDTVHAFHDVFTLAGAPDGPVSGLRFGAKDLFDVAGRVTGFGNPDWQRTHLSATRHADAVQCLLAAGATLVGKTHTDELAYSLMGANAHYGTPINSAAPDRLPGGSSSGSAAAVAAGLVDIGLGSDTGGSVRLPASFCGLYGMRPTHGRISLEGACPLAPSYDTVGWLTRDVATLTAAARALGLPDEGAPVRRLLLPVDAWDLADAAVVDALGPLVARLAEGLQSALVPVRLAGDALPQWREVFRVCQAAEVWQAHGAWVSATEPVFGPGIRERFAAAAAIAPTEVAAARDARSHIATRMNALLADDAVLLLPTSPAAAPARDAGAAQLESFRARALSLLCPAGHAGLPQISVPGAGVEEGPVGLSLVGARGADGALLALARRVETILRGQ